MKIKNSKYRWVIDAILFSGFMLCFFLDLTGLAFHQILGVFVGLFVLYHLVIHWDWVKTVAARLSGKTPARSRLYFVIDFALFAGLIGILGSGVVISTWLNLPLDTIQSWVLIHVSISIATALLTLLKIGLHWRWISVTWYKFFARRKLKPVPANAQIRVPSPSAISRREFLKVIVPATALTVAAAGVVIKSFNVLDLESPSSGVALAEKGASGTTPASSEITSTESSASTAQIAATSTPAAVQTTQVPTAVQETQTATTCTVSCPRGCSYPGHCRKYTDSNQNGKCDLGECL